MLRYAEAGTSREQQSAPMDVDDLAATTRVRWKTGSRSALRQIRVDSKVPKFAGDCYHCGNKGNISKYILPRQGTWKWQR